MPQKLTLEHHCDRSLTNLLNRQQQHTRRPITRLLIGCSGGGDSTALALLVGKFARSRDLEVSAIAVDHGLRPESIAEADHTVKRLRRRGLEADAVSVTVAPGGNLQLRARIARLDVLCQYARTRKADAVLLGHQRDDQAETVLQRLHRGSHWLGLRGIPAAGVWQGMPLLRPLLDVPRTTLRAYCQAEGVQFFDEPGNQNPGFLRVRARRLLQQRPDLTDVLLRIAAKAGYHAGLELAEARLLLSTGVTALAPDRLQIEPRRWHEARPESCQRLLGVLLRLVGGRDYPPRFHQTAALLDWIRAGTNPSRTLAGVLLQRRDSAPDAPIVLRPEHHTPPESRKKTSLEHNLHKTDLYFEQFFPISIQSGSGVFCR